MAGSSPIEPLLPALADLVAFLNHLAKPWSLIGGIAVTLQSEARFTNDIDAIVLNQNPNYAQIFESASQFGFSPAKDDHMNLASSTRIVSLDHRPSKVRVDIWMGLFPFEERAAKNGQRMEVSGISVKVSTPEDLIVLKAFAGRGVDMIDIETILESCRGLDRRRIEKDLRDLAEELESPDVWTRVETMAAWNDDKADGP